MKGLKKSSMVLERRAGVKPPSQVSWVTGFGFIGVSNEDVRMESSERRLIKAQPCCHSRFSEATLLFHSVDCCSCHHFDFFLIPFHNPGIVKPHWRSLTVTSFYVISVHPSPHQHVIYRGALFIPETAAQVHMSQVHFCETLAVKRWQWHRWFLQGTQSLKVRGQNAISKFKAGATPHSWESRSPVLNPPGPRRTSWRKRQMIQR